MMFALHSRPNLMPKNSRSTLVDVAKAAGVSLATVDRVINRRQGVRHGTMLKVEEVIRTLDFRRDPLASRLARDVFHRFVFLLPSGNNLFMRAIEAQVASTEREFSSQRVFLEVQLVDVFDPVPLARAISAIDTSSIHGLAVVALDHPTVRSAINDLVNDGVQVTTLVSDVPSSRRLRFIGVDNGAAGRTAGALMGRFLGKRKGEVAVIMGSKGLRDHAERLFGFSQVMAGEFPHQLVLDPIEGRDSDEINAERIASLLARRNSVVGIYNIGAGNQGIGEALRVACRELDVVFVGHELNEESGGFLLGGTMDAVINQDAGHEVRSSVRVHLSHLNQEPIDAERERIGIQIYLRENLP